jgi:phage-related protein
VSIFDKVAGFFSSAFHTVGDLASKVFNAIRSVWGFLVHIGGILSGAWDWMVNGVTWFTSQASNWAAAVFTTTWNTLTHVIPGAARWAFSQATRWAAGAIHTLGGFLKGLVKNVISWARRELHALSRTAKHWVSDVIKWVTGPIRWVLNVGRHIANLVLHPKALVQWFLGALIVPLIMWFLRSSAPVLVWMIRSVASRESELAHIIEDVLSRVI